MSRHIRQWSLRHLPSPVHHALGRLYYRMTGRAADSPDKPPRHLSFVYGFDPAFDKVGGEFLDHFIRLCGLLPTHRVLDVGCGIGRCAMPLTRYLSPDGGYCGFDIREDGITWCRTHIESRFPNFRFQHIDLRNATYHPGGRAAPEGVRFPYEDNQFDLVFTKSVFTHLQADVIEHYLRETHRVLKPGGCSLHTFFLLNETSRVGQQRGTSQFDFRFPVANGAAVSRSEPEKAIAFEEDFILELYRRAALAVLPPIRYGTWSGRADGLSGQDFVIARKA